MTSRDRRRRNSLDDFVKRFANESRTEDGLTVHNNSGNEGANEIEVIGGNTLLLDASNPILAPDLSSGNKLIEEGAPGGAPSATSTQIQPFPPNQQSNC